MVVADLLRQGRPLLKDDVVKLKQLAKLLNKPKNQQQIVELLDRLPESMTDQTRTGTYGAWYSYYVCGFSGRITLPGNLGTIPGLQQVLDDLLLVLRLVEQLGKLLQLDHVVLEQRPPLAEQVGDHHREVGDVVE